jgi:hypothetical protein
MGSFPCKAVFAALALTALLAACGGGGAGDPSTPGTSRQSDTGRETDRDSGGGRSY